MLSISLGSLLITILVGAFIGWLAGIIMKSKHGFLMTTLLGVIGSALGGWLANLLGLSSKGLLGTVLIGMAGTCILIAIVRAVLGKRF